MGSVFIFIALFVGSPVSLASADCGGILATTLTRRGFVSASLEGQGQLTYWQGNAPEQLALALGSSAPPSALSMAPDPLSGGVYLSAVLQDGLVHWITPGHWVLPVDFGQNVVSTSLYRPTPPEVEQLNNASKSEKGALERLVHRDQSSPTKWYLATKTEIYRSEIHLLYRHSLPEAAQEELRAGTRVLRTRGAPYSDWAPEPNAFFALADHPRHEFIIPTANADWYLHIGTFEPVAEFLRTSGNSVSAIHAINETELVINLGGTLLWGELTQSGFEVQTTLEFANVFWPKDVHARRMGSKAEVWAVNAVNGLIYHWDNEQMAPVLRPLAEQLPDGDSAVSVATFASQLFHDQLAICPAPKGSLETIARGQVTTQNNQPFLVQTIALSKNGLLFELVDEWNGNIGVEVQRRKWRALQTNQAQIPPTP